MIVRLSILILIIVVCGSCRKFVWDNPNDSNPKSQPSSLKDGLVAYYPFNGNANDESGNGNNGTVNGANLVKDRFGVGNRAYTFNGTSNYIVAGTTNFPIQKQPRSISLWFQTSKYPKQNLTYVMLNYGKSLNNESCGMAVDSVQTFGTRLNFFSWNNSDVIMTNPYSLNVWHNLIGTYDGFVGRLYFNGKLVSAKNSIWNTIVTTFTIGKNNETSGTYSYFFEGKLDEIRIYNRALTQEEITYLATH